MKDKYKLENQQHILYLFEEAIDYADDLKGKLKQLEHLTRDDVYVQKLVRDCELLKDDINREYKEWSDSVESK